MSTIDVISAGVIVAWAFWCVVSPRVHDGVLGKVLWMLLALAAMGVICSPGSTASSYLQATVAAIGARHFFIKTLWARARDCVLRRMRCSDCPQHKD